MNTTKIFVPLLMFVISANVVAQDASEQRVRVIQGRNVVDALYEHGEKLVDLGYHVGLGAWAAYECQKHVKNVATEEKIKELFDKVPYSGKVTGNVPYFFRAVQLVVRGATIIGVFEGTAIGTAAAKEYVRSVISDAKERASDPVRGCKRAIARTGGYLKKAVYGVLDIGKFTFVKSLYAVKDVSDDVVRSVKTILD
jgi:hypothetical protein